MLATLVSVLAVVTWRCALEPGETQTAAGSAATPAPAAFSSCGDEEDGPDTSLNLEGRACLLAASLAGTRVEFNTTRYTVEGRPTYWRVRVLAWGDVEVTVDNRADEFSGTARRRVTTYRCASLARDRADDQRIDVLGCTGGDALTF